MKCIEPMRMSKCLQRVKNQFMKKIGIIGSGTVALTLAKGFVKYSYDVMVGSNTSAKHAELLQKVPGVKTGTFSEAAAFGDMLVFAVKGSKALEALKQIDLSLINGKTIIDATNPIADAPPVNGVIQYTTSLSHSLLEQLQAAAPEVNFVKAFSCIGNAYMVDPAFDKKPAMFYCGNNDEARLQVEQVLQQFGHDPVDMGKAEAARAIEPLAMLWCIPGFLRNDWTHAFAYLRQ